MYPKLYKATHVGHPAVRWVCESVHNTEWLWHHTTALVAEYVKRYKKFHKTQLIINEFELVRHAMWRGYGEWKLHTPFVQCMPEQYKNVDPVAAYRAYYLGEKARFARWLPRAQPPVWWVHC